MAVLRHEDFRRLFLGRSASVIGDAIVLVALALYVTDIGSPTDVGLVLAARTVPLIALLAIGGVWADRLPRQKVIIATDLVSFALHATLAALIFTGVVEIWQIVVIEALFGAAEAFFRPAVTGLVPQTVPEDEIQQAGAAIGTMDTIAQFVGPALATVLVLGLGAGTAFAIDALTFLVSAWFLLRVRARRRGDDVARQTLADELREGWSTVRSHAWVWSIIAAFSLTLLLAYAPWMTLGPTIAQDIYGGKAAFGVLSAAIGAGTIAGSLIAFRWRPLHPMRTGMLLCLLWPVAMIAFAVGLPIALVAVLFVTAGIAFALFGIWWDTALAQRMPPHLLSRVSAYDWMGSLALVPLGYLLAGPLGEALGESAVLLAGAIGALATLSAALLVRATWTMRRIEPAQNSATPSSGVEATA
jgi:predicted MFS family arabinose efflux permease